MLIDTHSHIHEDGYPDPLGALTRAQEAGVEQIICVGTGVKSSQQAIEFARQHEGIFASIGVHPHDSKDGWEELKSLQDPTIVAIGEIGLDYFYNHSPRETQIKALNEQLQLAQDRNLPVIFHVREAFDDFWPIFENFPGLRGELHSFTDTMQTLEKALSKGLYIGVNGISTFTKDPVQRAMFAAIPVEKMLLETDSPFLTPTPFRGKVNEPAFVRNIAEYQADVYHQHQDGGVSFHEIASITTANARAVFNLEDAKTK